MENIKEMVDVNTIVGDPVQTPDGSVIMPISKVGFGFVAGGSDIRMGEEKQNGADLHNAHVALPFGGGSGGGVSITPIAFLVVGNGDEKMIIDDPNAPKGALPKDRKRPYEKDGKQLTLREALQQLAATGNVGAGGLVELDVDGKVVGK